MSDLLSKDLVSYDPLSEVTRRERRSLLGLSVIAIAVVKVPILPEKISALGIDFAFKNQKTFLSLFAIVLLYYLIAFLIYALTDYVAWRRATVIAQHNYTRQEIASNQALGRKGEQELRKKIAADHEMTFRGFAGYRLATTASRIRASYEFGVPVAVSIYAMSILLQFGQP